jgi:hypothetical protein
LAYTPRSQTTALRPNLFWGAGICGIMENGLNHLSVDEIQIFASLGIMRLPTQNADASICLSGDEN